LYGSFYIYTKCTLYIYTVIVVCAAYKLQGSSFLSANWAGSFKECEKFGL
jgi:hypothetical protein